MKKLHIAFFSHPFPAFVNPTIPLVSTLIRRGYRISYVTTDAFVGRIAALGAEVITFPKIELNENFREAIDDAGAVTSFFSPQIELVPKMLEFYEKNRPDLILHSQLSICGRIVAARLGVPGIQFHSAFALDKDNFCRQLRDAKHRQYIRDASRQLDRLLEQHGVASNDFVFNTGKFSIYFFPKVLQPVGEAFGSDRFFAGRCPGEQSYHESWKRQDTAGRPVVLVATSTMYVRGIEYFKMCIEALRELPLHVILSIGNEGDRTWYENLPPHFEVVQHVPHPQILPHVDLFVFLSGTISTAEAMYHGVPMLVTSHGFKELEWQGDNIDSLGIGIHLKMADTNAMSIRHFANQLLCDYALQNRVRQLQKIVRSDPGAEETANRIEDHMAEMGIE